MAWTRVEAVEPGRCRRILVAFQRWSLQDVVSSQMERRVRPKGREGLQGLGSTQRMEEH